MTYDNGILPQSLFVAGFYFGNKRYFDVAEETCEFLLKATFNGKHFSFVGNNGWYERGKSKARFDQQPIEAASTVMMLRTAYDATQNTEFLKLQRKAFDWFLGENDLHIPLYDFRTKGCCDGLMAAGVNLNQGAESTLSFLLSLVTVVESFAAADKIAAPTDVLQKAATPQQIKEIAKAAKKPITIKTTSSKTKSKKQVEELT